MVRKKINYLNIGCGDLFCESWFNLDINSNKKDAMNIDVRKGLPFSNESFEVIYSSHFLEHLIPEEANHLISECHRVLKRKGIIRLVVPDLENIVRAYLKELDGAKKGNPDSVQNYEWIILEIFDQLARNKSGGYMKKYLENNKNSNNDYIINRCGSEVIKMNKYYTDLIRDKTRAGETKYKSSNTSVLFILSKLFNLKFYNYYKIGKFRMSGENHQWMYDGYSLSLLLKKNNFINFHILQANKSSIPNWEKHGLESKDGTTHFPCSLFVEANK